MEKENNSSNKKLKTKKNFKLRETKPPFLKETYSSLNRQNNSLEEAIYGKFNTPSSRACLASARKIQRHEEILSKIKENNHKFEGCLDSPIIINNGYTIRVFCKEHKEHFELTAPNYLRNPKGLSCCSRGLAGPKIK